MNLKTLGVVALVAAAVALLVGFAVKQDAPAPSVGAFPGPDIYEHVKFFSSFTSGGVRATSTDDTTATFLASDLRNVTRIDFTPNVGSITATLPATSTLTDFVQKRGDTRTILLCNATSTAATPFTLAFGAGMNDVLATSTLAIGTNQCAELTFSRQADSDIDVFYDLGY